MNNKFKSNSPEEAKKWLNEMFAQGAEWGTGGQEIRWLGKRYYFCEDGQITFDDDYETFADSLLPEYSPILTPDFSNVQVGDRVRDLVFSEGEVVAVNTNSDFPICVRFLNGACTSYTLEGNQFPTANPTLFYPFVGQFPTADACKRPVTDAYELHGVTREQVKKYVDMAETLSGSLAKKIYWNNNGFSYIELESTTVYRCAPLHRPAPYEHWQTPIVLGGES